MASYGEQAVTLLQANAPLMALLTGGVYLFDSMNRKGLNRIQVPQAFMDDPTAGAKGTGLLKPTGIVYEATDQTTGELNSPTTGFTATVTPLMIWLYNDGSGGLGGTNGFTVIAQATDIVFTVLNYARLTGGFQILYKNTVKNKRDPLLNDACYWWLNYEAHGFRRK